MSNSSNPVGLVGFEGKLKIKVKRTWRSQLIYIRNSVVTTIKAIPKYLHQTI